MGPNSTPGLFGTKFDTRTIWDQIRHQDYNLKNIDKGLQDEYILNEINKELNPHNNSITIDGIPNKTIKNSQLHLVQKC